MDPAGGNDIAQPKESGNCCKNLGKILIILLLLAGITTTTVFVISATRKSSSVSGEDDDIEAGKEKSKDDEEKEITMESLKASSPENTMESLKASSPEKEEESQKNEHSTSEVPPPPAQAIDESQNPEALQVFQSTDKYAPLQCIPVEHIEDVDKTSPAVFYKFTGASNEHHLAELAPFAEDEPISAQELAQVSSFLDEFLLDLSLFWFFAEVELVKDEESSSIHQSCRQYAFKFTVQQHLLSESGKKTLQLTVKSDAIDKHMNNIWIRSEEAKPEELDLHLLRTFSFATCEAGEQIKLILPVCLLRPEAIRCQERDQMSHSISQDLTKLCEVAREHFSSQVISYCIEDSFGKCYLFYDIFNPPTDQVSPQFERIASFLFSFPSEFKRWRWKELVDGEMSYYPDPVCIEEHFQTIRHFSYSVIICPMWEVFISTGMQDNAKHYNILLNVGDAIKMLAISQVNPNKMLLQFLTENPMSEVKSASFTAPSALKYAFIAIVADFHPSTGNFVFEGVDEEEDTDGLVEECKNACNYFSNPHVDLPSLSYKIKF